MKHWPSLNHKNDFNFLVPFCPFFLVTSFPALFPDARPGVKPECSVFLYLSLLPDLGVRKVINEICCCISLGLKSHTVPPLPFYVLKIWILILYVHYWEGEIDIMGQNQEGPISLTGKHQNHCQGSKTGNLSPQFLSLLEGGWAYK